MPTSSRSFSSLINYLPDEHRRSPSFFGTVLAQAHTVKRSWTSAPVVIKLITRTRNCATQCEATPATFVCDSARISSCTVHQTATSMLAIDGLPSESLWRSIDYVRCVVSLFCVLVFLYCDIWLIISNVVCGWSRRFSGIVAGLVRRSGTIVAVE